MESSAHLVHPGPPPTAISVDKGEDWTVEYVDGRWAVRWTEHPWWRGFLLPVGALVSVVLFALATTTAWTEDGFMGRVPGWVFYPTAIVAVYGINGVIGHIRELLRARKISHTLFVDEHPLLARLAPMLNPTANAWWREVGAELMLHVKDRQIVGRGDVATHLQLLDAFITGVQQETSTMQQREEALDQLLHLFSLDEGALRRELMDTGYATPSMNPLLRRLGL